MCANRKVLFLGLIVYSMAVFRGRADTINYWRFEEGSGTSAADETGLADGMLVSSPSGGGLGPLWSTDVPSTTVPATGQQDTYSLPFYPSGGRVSFSPIADMDYGSEFTLEYFFRLDSLPVVDSPYSMLYFNDGDTGLRLSLWEFGGSPSPQMELSSSVGNILSPDLNVSVDQWYHFALVRDDGTFSMFLDGTNVASQALGSTSDTFVFSPGGEYFAGPSLPTFNYPGLLDEIRISNVALSPDQFLNAVPEPSTFLLMSMAVGTLGLPRKQFRARN